jgi:hypothetical protein
MNSTRKSCISPKVQKVSPIEKPFTITTNRPFNDNSKLLCYEIGIHQELHTVQQSHGADCLQRSLRFRFRQRLVPGVDVTAEVKCWSPIF